MATENHSESQARTQIDHIEEMVTAWQNGREFDGYGDALDAIHDHPLSVEVRSNWHAPGQAAEDAEYCILLCTGGPAVRIVGELDSHGEPDSARIEHQDWGTPWTEYHTDKADVLLDYARCFNYGT